MFEVMIVLVVVTASVAIKANDIKNQKQKEEDLFQFMSA